MRAYKSSDLDKDSYVNKREFPVLLRYLGSKIFEFIGMGGYLGFGRESFIKRSARHLTYIFKQLTSELAFQFQTFF